MNAKQKNIPTPEGREQLEALRRAVGKALEKKRRLGQYAVTWQHDKPVVAGEDALGANDNTH
jgi:hypothetical protein